jgi:hypothetical protein
MLRGPEGVDLLLHVLDAFRRLHIHCDGVVCEVFHEDLHLMQCGVDRTAKGRKSKIYSLRPVCIGARGAKS